MQLRHFITAMISILGASFALAEETELVPLNATHSDAVFQSMAKLRFSNTHIGMGLFTGANHDHAYRGPEFEAKKKKGVIFLNYPHYRQIVTSGFFLYKDLSSPNGNNQGIDTRIWYLDKDFNLPAIPLLIAENSKDLVGLSMMSLGIPEGAGLNRYFARGKIIDADGSIKTTANAAVGMSGSGLYVEFQIEGQPSEYYIAGSLRGMIGRSTMITTNAKTFRGDFSIYEHYSPNFYRQFCRHVKSLPLDIEGLPRFAILADQSGGKATGCQLNEYIIGGEGDDILISGAGDDILIGGAGSDKFVFQKGDGKDIIRDFDFLEDKIIIEDDILTMEALFKLPTEGREIIINNE